MNDEKGFTLIELMIVVVILGILAAMAVPRFQLASTRAKEKEAETTLKAVVTVQGSYYARSGHYSGDLAGLEDSGWTIPTRLEYYTIPAITGGGAGSTSFTACMSATQPGLNNIAVDQNGNFSTC